MGPGPGCPGLQEFLVGRIGQRVGGAVRVDDVLGCAVRSDDVHQVATGESVLALRPGPVLLREDERRLLDGPAARAWPFADGPALGLLGVVGTGQAVGGIRNTDRGAVRWLAAVEYALVHRDDAVLVGVEEELGRSHVEDRMQLLLPVGLQDDVPRRGVAGHDHVPAGLVPPLRCGRAEQTDRTEHGEHHDADDRTGDDRAQRPGGAFLRTGRRRLQERRECAALREGVGVQFIAP